MSETADVLGRLCESDPPEITGQGILTSERKSALQTLLALGALTHVGNSESILCPGCDDPHPVAVEYAGDGRYRAYCPEVGLQPVSPDDLQCHTVDESWIVNAIRAGIGLARTDIAPGWRAAATPVGRGRFGPYVCELFFGRRLADRRRFAEARTMVAARAGNAPAVLITTTPTDLVPGDPPPRCAILALADVLEVNPGGTRLIEAPILAALRGPDGRAAAAGIGAIFSPGYRSGVVGDIEYHFTDKQALIVEALHEAWKTGNPRRHQTELQGAGETSQRIGQLFAGHPAYGTLIQHDRSGFYWLNL